MNKEILRTDVYYAHVILYNQYIKTRSIVFADKFNGSQPLPFAGIDIYNDVEYPIIYGVYDAASYLINEHPNKIYITDCIALNPLLSYFGFSSTLDEQARIDILKNLFNGKFCFEYCELFGYKKKDSVKWRNGLQVPNVAVQQKSDYDISKYELVDPKNELVNYFKYLAEINPENPSDVFKPLEEEGNIRKRILLGSDKNV